MIWMAIKLIMKMLMSDYLKKEGFCWTVPGRICAAAPDTVGRTWVAMITHHNMQQLE